MAPLMGGEKKHQKKQKHQDVRSDGREEETEAKWGTSEGREEEAGMPSPRTSSDSHQASAILAALERERMVPTMRNPSAVASKI